MHINELDGSKQTNKKGWIATVAFARKQLVTERKRLKKERTNQFNLTMAQKRK